MSKKRVFALYRESRGYSQKDLAKLLGVKQQAVSSWEIGRTTPKPYQMKKLAELLQTEMDVLFYDIFNVNEEEEKNVL